MIRKISYFFLLALLLGACREETDIEKPTAIFDSPTEGQIVTTADGLRLVATLADNNGLLQYKLSIFGIDSLNDVGSDSTYSLIYIEGVANQVAAVYIDEIIDLPPSTFNGFYMATLTCIDIEGNQAVRDTVRFQIVNSFDSEPAVFNVSGPTANDTLQFGQGFSVNGNITDSQALIFSSIYIGRVNRSHEILTFEFLNIQNNMVDFDGIGWYFQVDSTWAEGSYEMYLTAWDNYSGVSHSIPFEVNY